MTSENDDSVFSESSVSNEDSQRRCTRQREDGASNEHAGLPSSVTQLQHISFPELLQASRGSIKGDNPSSALRKGQKRQDSNEDLRQKKLTNLHSKYGLLNDQEDSSEIFDADGGEIEVSNDIEQGSLPAYQNTSQERLQQNSHMKKI